MSDTTFMGYRCTFHVRPDNKIHREHNIRDPQLIQHEKHIDKTRYSETTLDLGTLDQAYETIFRDALDSYNEGKRKDRQIKNYLELIRKDNRRGKHKNQRADGSRKAAYEAYITIGNRDDQPDHEEAKKILKLFVEKWIPSHYKQIKPILISYHDDEFSYDEETGEKIYSPIHCHFDFIYVANSLTPEEQKEEKQYRLNLKAKRQQECIQQGIKFDNKAWQKIDWQEDLVRRTGKSLTSGPTLQSSMSAALMQMGFKTSRGKGTAQTQFEEQIRHDLQDFAESMGLKIDRTPGQKHQHEEKNIFQLKKDNEKKEKRLKEKEKIIEEQSKNISEAEENLSNIINDYNQNVFEHNKKVEKLLEKENDINTKQKDVDLQQNEIEFREKELERHDDTIESYRKICSDVQKEKLSIDNAERKLFASDNKMGVRKRLENFVTDCKKIVTNLVMELNKYKRAFSHFWKATPKDFNNLANEMLHEGCKTYEMYYKKSIYKLRSSDINTNIANNRNYLNNKSKIEENYNTPNKR